LLRLAHPIMPFITEEIWQRVAPLAGVTAATIMLQPYPESNLEAIDTDAETQIQWVMDFLLGIRRIRGEMNIAPGKPLNVLLQNGSLNDQAYLSNNQSYLLKLGRLEGITWLNAEETAPESAIALVGDMKVLIPMAGLIDKEAELARLEKEIQRIEKELPRIEGKLSNASFVDKAPADVIAKEREKLAGLQSSLKNLNDQYAKIKAL
ncbi:MAG: class I tRNA ligase family protein, partial [Methylomonas sp.]